MQGSIKVEIIGGARKQIIATHTKVSTWQHLDLKIIGGAAAPLAPPVDTAL